MTHQTEKQFIDCLLWLKNKLENGVIKRLIWTNARDMTADGHTNGAIERTAPHALMNGNMTIQHKRVPLASHNPRFHWTQARRTENTTPFVVRSVEIPETSSAIAHDSVNACETKLRADIPDTAKCAGETIRASIYDATYSGSKVPAHRREKAKLSERSC